MQASTAAGGLVSRAANRHLGKADREAARLSSSQHHTGQPLLTPDEVRHLRAQTQLLFLAGQRLVLASKLACYADPEFKTRYDPV
jgi:type IV secretion system protein VirD4